MYLFFVLSGHYPLQLDALQTLQRHPYLSGLRGRVNRTSRRSATGGIGEEIVDIREPRFAYPLLDLPEGFLPSIQYDKSGQRFSKQLQPNIVFMRRNRLDSTSEQPVTKFWETVDEMFQQLLPSANMGTLPFL